MEKESFFFNLNCSCTEDLRSYSIVWFPKAKKPNLRAHDSRIISNLLELFAKQAKLRLVCSIHNLNLAHFLEMYL